MDEERNQETTPEEKFTPQAEQKKYALVVTNKSDNVETRFDLEEGKELIIGADPEADIPLSEDAYASWKHCRVTLMGSDLEVEDLNSTNGVFVKIEEPMALFPGQTLLIGSTLVCLKEVGGE